jgi:hypothetical protein
MGLAGAVALAAAAGVCPTPVHAQVELVPGLGYYWPVGGWREPDDGSGFPPLRRQLSAALFSARLVNWVSGRFGLEVTLAHSPSQVAVSRSTGTTDFSGAVFLTSARALLKLGTLNDGPEHNRASWGFMLSAGGGLVHRAGLAWENTSGVTAPVLVFGTDVTVDAFRLTLEDYISWAQFNGGSPTATRPRVHHDLVVSLGAVLRLGKQR